VIFCLSGSFSETAITLSPEAITEFGLAAGDIVEVNYIANISELFPSVNLNTLPAVRNVNKFSTTTQTNIGYQPISNVYSGSIATKNLWSVFIFSLWRAYFMTVMKGIKRIA